MNDINQKIANLSSEKRALLELKLKNKNAQAHSSQTTPPRATGDSSLLSAFCHRTELSGEVLVKQLNYWQQQLAGANPLLELPTDRPRPPVQTDRGTSQFFPLPQSLSGSLQQLSHQQGVTLYMTLLAAFQTLLYRYTQQTDILVGSPIAVPNWAESAGLMGFFVNTLVLRTDLSDHPSFLALLQRVRAVTLEAHAYQDLPFDRLVEELQPERSLSYNPLFQVMFVLQNAPRQTENLLGLAQTPVKLAAETAKVDLTLLVEEKAGKLVGTWEYNSDLFNADTIARMTGHFQTLLEAIVANPHQSISQLPLLTAKEKHQLLVEWNQTYTEYPQDKCLHQLFEERVAQNPSALAVSFEGQHLTYEELNRQANRLAHYLKSLGVGSNALVGICLERSLEMAVGFLGIFKAGAAYVPLDPAYPSDRLAFMVEDSQVAAILTRERLLEMLPAGDAKLVCLDRDWQEISQQSGENPLVQIASESLAYVTYTSGSTGKPKGVKIAHQSLINHNTAMVELFGLQGSDRVLQSASISFDIAVEEMFPTWLSGASLILRTDEVLASTRNFLQFVEREQISVLNIPTALWHEVVHGMREFGAQLPNCVRLVIVGGEKASRQAYEHWWEIVGDRCRWLNTYGPTETTVSATFYEPAACPATQNSLTEIPIGRPIANTQIYILDRQLQPVPIGVAGELHIGGAGLAEGYLNRPELTAEKFISHPFTDDPQAALYKTGDLVRYLPDGNIEFIGRIDNQVKIRGFRIELGGIETALTQFPDIKETCVIVRADDAGDKRLIAYFAAKQKIESVELRAFLAQKLPIYMIPAFFVQLDVLPLTPNGKVDRQALPSVSDSQAYQQELVAPRDRLEQQLVEIWESVLGRHPIGIHHDFFALGGHSLLSVRLVAEIEKTFNSKFPLTSVFQISTVAELAHWLRQKERDVVEPAYLCLEDYQDLLAHSAGRAGTHLGRRGLIVEILPENPVSSQPFVWIGDLDFSKNLGLQQPIYSMPGTSWKPLHSPKNYIVEIASLLVDELLTVKPSGSYNLGAYCYEALVAIEMTHQLQKRGREVSLLVLIDLAGPSKLYQFCRKLNWYWCILQFHLLRLKQLSLADKWHYLAQRLLPSKRRDAREFDLDQPDNRSTTPWEAAAAGIEAQTWETITEAMKSYIPRKYNNKVVSIESTKTGLRVNKKELVLFDLSRLFPKNGWKGLFAGKFEIYQVPCSHAMVNTSPYVEQIGQIIGKFLPTAQPTAESVGRKLQP